MLEKGLQLDSKTLFRFSHDIISGARDAASFVAPRLLVRYERFLLYGQSRPFASASSQLRFLQAAISLQLTDRNPMVSATLCRLKTCMNSLSLAQLCACSLAASRLCPATFVREWWVPHLQPRLSNALENAVRTPNALIEDGLSLTMELEDEADIIGENNDGYEGYEPWNFQGAPSTWYTVVQLLRTILTAKSIGCPICSHHIVPFLLHFLPEVPTHISDVEFFVRGLEAAGACRPCWEEVASVIAPHMLFMDATQFAVCAPTVLHALSGSNPMRIMPFLVNTMEGLTLHCDSMQPATLIRVCGCLQKHVNLRRNFINDILMSLAPRLSELRFPGLRALAHSTADQELYHGGLPLKFVRKMEDALLALDTFETDSIVNRDAVNFYLSGVMQLSHNHGGTQRLTSFVAAYLKKLDRHSELDVALASKSLWLALKNGDTPSLKYFVSVVHSNILKLKLPLAAETLAWCVETMASGPVEGVQTFCDSLESHIISQLPRVRNAKETEDVLKALIEGQRLPRTFLVALRERYRNSICSPASTIQKQKAVSVACLLNLLTATQKLLQREEESSLFLALAQTAASSTNVDVLPLLLQYAICRAREGNPLDNRFATSVKLVAQAFCSIRPMSQEVNLKLCISLLSSMLCVQCALVAAHGFASVQPLFQGFGLSTWRTCTELSTRIVLESASLTVKEVEALLFPFAQVAALHIGSPMKCLATTLLPCLASQLQSLKMESASQLEGAADQLLVAEHQFGICK